MKSLLAFAFLALAVCGCSSQESKAENAAPAKPVAASPGKRVFDRWCLECHGDGPRYPGTASLAAKYGKDLPAALEQRQDLSPDVVAYFVRKGVSIMPPFRKTEITDAELAALGAYLSHQPEKTAAASSN